MKWKLLYSILGSYRDNGIYRGYLWLARNEGMEKNMKTTMGVCG